MPDQSLPPANVPAALSWMEGTRMSFEERIESLKNKHQALEEELHTETHRPQPDDEAISRLKREKLKLKDEIAKLSKSA